MSLQFRGKFHTDIGAHIPQHLDNKCHRQTRHDPTGRIECLTFTGEQPIQRGSHGRIVDFRHTYDL